MLITIMVILLLIWAAVVGSIYSNFLVFYSNFSESTNYHKAYYAAISALERGELVTKQRQPWYHWCGWRQNYDPDGCPYETSTSPSDNKVSNNNFSYLSDNDSNVYRSINSKTDRIPALWDNWVGQWDVEPLLQADDSNQYNMMDYENSQVFLLYYDDYTKWTPYTKTSCVDNNWDRNNKCKKSQATKITWRIRLPEKLYAATPNGFNFWNLNTQEPLVWGYEGFSKDDVIVDWQIRWKKDSNSFTIYSTQSKNSLQDSSIRESDINNQTTLWHSHDGLYYSFWNHKSPIYYNENPSGNPNKGGGTSLTIVGNINNTADSSFSNIFWSSSLLQLRFSLLNLLKSENGMLYPFLEYYAEFDGKDVADKYYTIDAEWYYGGYKVNKKVWKPTVKESVLSSFTSIFK